jgi:hypothetical protein
MIFFKKREIFLNEKNNEKKKNKKFEKFYLKFINLIDYNINLKKNHFKKFNSNLSLEKCGHLIHFYFIPWKIYNYNEFINLIFPFNFHLNKNSIFINLKNLNFSFFNIYLLVYFKKF